MTETLLNRDSLNHISYQVQDLQLRVNILTYKIHYGTWPKPHQINGTDIENLSNIELTVSSTTINPTPPNKCTEITPWRPKNLSRSENLGLRDRQPKTLVETSQKIYYHRPTQFSIAPIPEKSIVNNENHLEKYKIPREITEKSSNRQETVLNHENDRVKNDIFNVTEQENKFSTAWRRSRTRLNREKSPKRHFKPLESTESTLTHVKQRLESLQGILKVFNDPQNPETTSDNDKKLLEARGLLEKLNESRTDGESDEKSNFPCKKRILQRKFDDEKKSSDTEDELSLVSDRLDTSKGSGSDTSDATMLKTILNHVRASDWSKTIDCDPVSATFCPSKLLEIISEEQSGSSCTERASKIHISGEKSSKICDKPLGKVLEASGSLKNAVVDIEKIFQPLEESGRSCYMASTSCKSDLTDQIAEKTSHHVSSSGNTIEITSTSPRWMLASEIETLNVEKPVENSVQVTNELVASENELKRRPSHFSISPEQQLTINGLENDDLIDLNDEKSHPGRIHKLSRSSDCSSTLSLLDVNAEMLSSELTLECTSIKPSNVIENLTDTEEHPPIKDSSLIELETVIYNELTSKEKFNLKCRELTSKNIFNTDSNVYLTDRGSLSDISTVNCGLKLSEKSEIEKYQVINDCRLNFQVKINFPEENTATSKDSALSESPQDSLTKTTSTNESNMSLEPLANVEISSLNSSEESLSYVDACSQNFFNSSGISLSIDKPEIDISLETMPDTIYNLSSNNSHQSTGQIVKKELRKPRELKDLHSKMENIKKPEFSRAQSTLGLTPDLSERLKSIKNSGNNSSQRRSRSYVTPRKREASPRCLTGEKSGKSIEEQLETSKNNNLSLSKNNSNRKFTSKTVFDDKIKCTTRSSSKSCIPVLQTRLEGMRREENRRKSPQRGPLTMPTGVPEIHQAPGPGKSAWKGLEGDQANDDERQKNSETQRVIYVNIATDSDCVAKIVDSREFLEYMKDKDFRLPNAGIIKSSSEDSNPQLREIEVLAKPSVMHTSTSISGLP